jgi:dynein heavy chain, axonemal
MVEGIPPREASDRLTIYQSRFDELWRKYETYSGGEELFGIPVTNYKDLQRIKKELNLLQKLYGLYNTVIDTINSYYVKNLFYLDKNNSLSIKILFIRISHGLM